MKTSFQDGVDQIYNKCKSCGSTPSTSSPDSICTAIQNIYNNRYNSGYNAGDSAGYSRGYSAGKSAGYNEGYSAGDSAGYSRGYTAGKKANTGLSSKTRIGSSLSSKTSHTIAVSKYDSNYRSYTANNFAIIMKTANSGDGARFEGTDGNASVFSTSVSKSYSASSGTLTLGKGYAQGHFKEWGSHGASWYIWMTYDVYII